MKHFMMVVTSALLLGLSTAKLVQAQAQVREPPSGDGILSKWHRYCVRLGVQRH